MRRIYFHHELHRLGVDIKLHWLRRALSLIRNLRKFQEHAMENGFLPLGASNRRLRHAYLVYTCGKSSRVVQLNFELAVASSIW